MSFQITFWQYRKGTLTRHGSRSFIGYFNVFQNDEKKNSDRGFLQVSNNLQAPGDE